MKSNLSASISLLLLSHGLTGATPSPTMDAPVSALLTLAPTTPQSAFQSTATPNRLPISSPTQAPRLNPTILVPTSPTKAAPPLSPAAALISSPTVVSVEASAYPSLIPSLFPSISPTAVLITYEPSLSPVSSPSTKRPTRDTLTSPVNIVDLQMTLNNAGTLLEMNRWQVETERFYNEYFQDISCLVIFVKSQVSNQNSMRINTITYDLILQSGSNVPGNAMAYALKPFQDLAANIKYGNVLRGFINFERLSLPISVPKLPRRTNDSKDPMYTRGQLGINVLVGIIVAGLLAVFVVTFGYTRWRRHQRLSKLAEQPTSTFRISSDDDVSTIGPVDDDLVSHDSEYGDQSVATVDYDDSIVFGSIYFGRTVVSSMGGRVDDLVILKTRSDDDTEEDEFIDILVPPGKLGIIIDTPDDGPPVIHAIKETSVIRDMIRRGDKLLAIDDEDVREMTAIEASKIISKKSSNAQRKFTIMRPYDV